MLKPILITVILISNSVLIKSDNKGFVEKNNKLSLNLLNVLPQNQNNFFSPLTITYSLLTLLNGANGLTETELKNVLDIKQNETISSFNDNIKSTLESIRDKNVNEVIVRFASRILTSNTFNLSANFQNNIRDNFNSSIDLVDFSRDAQNITDTINGWISEQTNGKIDRLFGLLENDTLLVITNALYLSAGWDIPFDAYSTAEDNFYNFDDSDDMPTKVQMMRNSRKFKYISDSRINASVVEVPFVEESNISMIIILPDERRGLNKTIENLDSETLNTAVNNVLNVSRKTQLDLYLPQFQLETEYNLKNSLKKLGLRSVFESSADLSGITGHNDLHVSKVIHKAVFKVNEKGAEASGAVGIVGVPHIWIPPVQVKVDRPFLFLLIDNKSSLILFVGQVLAVQT